MKKAEPGDLRNLMDVELESVVIGTILTDGEPAYRQVAGLLRVPDFTLEKHRRIFSAIAGLAPGVAPDVEAVANYLIEAGQIESINGFSGLLEVHGAGIPGTGLVHFARALRQKSNSRRAIKLAGKLRSELGLHGLNGNRPDISAVAQELIALAEEQPSDEHAILNPADLPAVGAMQDATSFIREPELPEGAIVALTGDSGSGKSTLATAWIRDAIADGRAGLLLDRENPRSVALDRMRRLGLQDGPSLRWWGGWNGEVPALDSRLIFDWTKACDPRPVIVIDSLAAFSGGDENNASDMRAFMHQARRLADLGAAVIVVHHDGKAESARDYRGSSDFKAAVDQAFHVSNITSDLGRLDRVTLRCFKSRYGFSGTLIYHYANGRMVRDERVDAPARNVASELTALLRMNPASSGDKIEKLAAEKSISRKTARDFLQNGLLEGSIVFETHDGNRRRYFLRAEN